MNEFKKMNNNKIKTDKDFNRNRIIKVKKSRIKVYIVFGKRIRGGVERDFAIRVEETEVKKFPKFELEIVNENEKKFLSFNVFEKGVKKYPLDWLTINRSSVDEKPEEVLWETILDEDHYQLIIGDEKK